MAVAVEALPAAADAAEGAGAAAGRAASSGQEAAPWRAISGASAHAPAAASGTAGAVRRAYASVSTPSRTAHTVTRLVWAAVMFLVVLEIAALATGQHWGFSLPAASGQKPQPQPYQPLYRGQQATSIGNPLVASQSAMAGANALVGIGLQEVGHLAAGLPGLVP
jgi:hypothetical protein